MENSMNTLIGDLTETFKGTSMVPQMDNSTVASTTLNYDYPEIHEVDLVATEKVSEMTTLKDIIERTNMFPIKASNVFVDEDEEDQTIENLSVVKKTFHYPSIALSTIEVSLFEYAQDVLKKLLSTVNLYSQQDWIEAYNRIDFDIKTSKPDNAIRDICISNEIYEIAKNSSWDYVYDMGDSYIFNGIFWVKLEEKQVLHFMRDISIQMGIKKFEAIASKFGENIYKEVIYSGALSPTKKPTGKLLLNMMNGTLHVSNNELSLKPHDKKDFLKYQLQFNYNINAVNQEWLQFLEDVLPDKDTQKTLQQSLGSLFLRGVKLTKMVLLYGTGANGKSVIFDVINGLLGKELVSNYSLNSLTDPKGYHRAQIKDKLINFASDIDLSKIDIGIMKTLASGEQIECRLPYKEPFIMEDYAKCVFNLNDISTAKIEKTEGFYRRFMFVPFNVCIPEYKQDKMLAEKLLHDKAGILNWLLEGAIEVLKSGSIYECQESHDFMLKFREQPTAFEKFLLNYQVKADIQNKILSSALYKYYEEMCIEDGVKAMSNIMFSKQLEEAGYTKNRENTGVMWEVSLNS